MKKPFVSPVWSRWPVVAVLLACLGGSVGCMTTYDSAGRPVQSVDPAAAAAGAVALGLAGYAIGSNNQWNHYAYYPGGGYCYPGPWYGGGHYYPRPWYGVASRYPGPGHGGGYYHGRSTVQRYGRPVR